MHASISVYTNNIAMGERMEEMVIHRAMNCKYAMEGNTSSNQVETAWKRCNLSGSGRMQSFKVRERMPTTCLFEQNLTKTSIVT